MLVFLPSENGAQSGISFAPPSFLHTMQNASRELYYHMWEPLCDLFSGYLLNEPGCPESTLNTSLSLTTLDLVEHGSFLGTTSPEQCVGQKFRQLVTPTQYGQATEHQWTARSQTNLTEKLPAIHVLPPRLRPTETALPHTVRLSPRFAQLNLSVFESTRSPLVLLVAHTAYV